METAPDPSSSTREHAPHRVGRSQPASPPSGRPPVNSTTAFLKQSIDRPRPSSRHLLIDRLHAPEDRRTVSIFAEHGPSVFLPETDRYTTDRERPVRLPIADSPLAEVSRSISRTGPT